jgi:hypothetical protein
VAIRRYPLSRFCAGSNGLQLREPFARLNGGTVVCGDPCHPGGVSSGRGRLGARLARLHVLQSHSSVHRPFSGH